MIVYSRQIADRLRAEVDIPVEEFLDEMAQRVGLGESRNLVAELEVVQDVLHVGREPVEIGLEIVLQFLLGGAGPEVAQQERRGVVECLPGGGSESIVLIGDPFSIQRGFHIHYGLFGRLQHGIETTQNGHRQNNIAVFAPYIDITEDIIRYIPNKIREPVELCLIHVSP
jgi:hypothetical protein